MSIFNNGDKQSAQIFISYRREGGGALAHLIYDRLLQKNYRVFLDVESLRSGMFNIALYKKIEECKDFIIVLPKNSLNRCVDPEDWVRLEIEHALELKKNMIPIMMRNFKFPETLPDSLKTLPKYNGVEASMELFDGTMAKIMGMLISKPDPSFPLKKYLIVFFITVLAIFALINKQSSNEPPESQKQIAIQKVDQAWELIDRKKHKDAIKLCNEAIELYPNYANAYYKRGLAYSGISEHNQAIDDYTKAIELDSKNAIAYNLRGFSYYVLKQYEQAISDYDKAIELYPDYATAYKNRGYAYYLMEKYEQAISNYDKAIELYPNSNWSGNDFDWLYNKRGEAYQKLGQYEQALKDYDKAIELNPRGYFKDNRELCLKAMGK